MEIINIRNGWSLFIKTVGDLNSVDFTKSLIWTEKCRATRWAKRTI